MSILLSFLMAIIVAVQGVAAGIVLDNKNHSLIVRILAMLGIFIGVFSMAFYVTGTRIL